jgi:Protein of unknown function (DUF551)
MNPRDTIARARYGQACDGGYEIVGSAAASAILEALTTAGYRIVGPADMEKAAEAGAGALEKVDFPRGLRPFGITGRKIIADAVLTAASPHMPVPAGWISVTDKLPGEQGCDSENVLCFLNGHCDMLDMECRNGGGWGIRIGFYDADKQCFRAGGIAREVTHWMPLPAAPKPAALTQEKTAEGEK